MKSKPLILKAATPEQLKAELGQFLKKGNRENQFTILILTDPQILTQAFQQPKTNQKNLLSHLLAEAEELLNINSDEIVLDYQILATRSHTIHGVYLAIPKKRLLQYLNILDHSGLIPLRITSQLAAKLGAFYLGYNLSDNKISIIDFSEPNEISIVVYDNKACQLVRHLPRDEFPVIRKEIIGSLRQSLSLSHIKKFHHIYIAGAESYLETLREELNHLFQAEITLSSAPDISLAIMNPANPCQLNVARNYSMTAQERQRFSWTTRLLLAGVVAILLGQILMILWNAAVLRRFKKNYTTAEYEEAIQIRKELDSLK